MSLGDTSTCARVAPPTPEMMRAELASKTFTNQSDSDMVLGLLFFCHGIASAAVAEVAVPVA